MLSVTRDQLAHAISAAFVSPPPRPGDLIEPGADVSDAADIRRALRGRRWTAVPRRVPIDERSGISWFTPAALQHYLPLWLLASLDEEMVRFWTVTQLGFAAEKTAHQARFKGLSAAERQAICLFLRWIADTHADERASALKALTWWSDGSRA